MSNPIVVPSIIVKYLPALAIGATTACFALGLLIVNLRLSYYGIYSLEFARTEYILVGAVFVFLVATACASFAYSKEDFKCVIPDIKEKRYGSALGNAFFGLMTLSAPLVVIFGFLFLNTGYIYSWIAWLSILGLILFGHIAQLFISEFATFMHETNLDAENGNAKRASTANRLLGQIAFLLISLGMYANLMYPNIPPAFGGGHKSPVMLYPTPRGLDICKALSLPLQSNQTIVGPIEILTESERELVLLIPDVLSGKQHAVRLNKELFDAVQATTPKIN